jgi:predicted  nucleic acid-binding Zn-ribbon protein
VKDLLKLLIDLQDIDSRILEKRIFIEKVPGRIFKVDEPLKQARLELEKIQQKNEVLGKKKHEKENMLEDINQKIKKMQSHISEIKTNKEYQAYLKEMGAVKTEIADIEDEILFFMEELDNSLKQQKEKEDKVKIVTDKINALKKELDQEVEKKEKELSLLNDERDKVVGLIEPDTFNLYTMLINSGNGIALTRAKDEICLGCNINMPPQLFVEIRKNEEIIQCPQCRRILYYSEGE